MSESVPTTEFIVVQDILLANWQGSLGDDNVVWVDTGVLDSQNE